MALNLPTSGTESPQGSANDVYNALRNQALKQRKQQLENEYYAPTAQANALSKLAYANLMGPQFLSKLMGNEHIVANIPDEQKRLILQNLQQAGQAPYTANAMQNVFSGGTNRPGVGNQVNNSLLGLLLSKLTQQTPAQPQQSGISRPAQQSNVNQQPMPQEFGAINRATPQEVSQIANYGNGRPREANQPTYAENVGTYKGIVEEGKEAGNIRAKDIKELDDTVFNADTKLATLNDINKMIASPEIREIRQTPLLAQHEMAWFAKEGTPAQQQLVGRLYAQLGRVVADSARDFAGQFRKGEQELLEGMKPNPGDTVDTMIGKSESLTVMAQLLKQRSALTSQIMSQYHISKGKAEAIADKQINGDKIRSQVHNQLNPKPTDDDIAFMANKYKVSPNEIKKRLKAKGIL